MTTTIDDPTMHAPTFEDRLLDALLVELDAPAAVLAEARRAPVGVAAALPASAGRTRGPRASTVVGIAAAAALLAGAGWVFTGGLDPDAPVRVEAGAGLPSADPAPFYLGFPGDTAPLDGSHTISLDPVPTARRAAFRPVAGGADRAVITVAMAPLGFVRGEPVSSPSGRTVTVIRGGFDPGHAVALAWIEEAGTTLAVSVARVAGDTRRPLQQLSDEDVMRFTGGLAIEDGALVQADPAFEQISVDDPVVPAADEHAWTVGYSGAPGSPVDDLYVLQASSGEDDLADLDGDRVTVRGREAVVAAVDTASGTSVAVSWTEHGMTLTLSAIAAPGTAPSTDALVALADSLVEVDATTFQEHQGVFELSATPVTGTPTTA